MTDFDLPGALRRIRRVADCSQRELADRLGVSKSSIAAVETGARDLTVRLLATAAALAGLRLALLDDAGDEVASMADGAVRDQANRRFPAHLDVRYGDQDWWHGEERYAREQPWYTFDRLRWTRDHWRARTGVPEDHQLPEPGDSPEDRAAARRRERLRRRAEERERAFLAGEFAHRPDPFECRCLPACDEMNPVTGELAHGGDCPCLCDLS